MTSESSQPPAQEPSRAPGSIDPESGGPKAPAPSNAAAPIALAIALMLAAGAGGFVAYRMTALHGSTLTPMQYPGTVRSKPATEQPDESAPAVAKKIPDHLPDVDMPDTKGVPHKLSEWKGRPLMVNFWATWCDPCRREIPLLKRLRQQRSAESLEIVGIAVDFQDAVVDYTHKIGIDYPVLIGEKDGIAAIDAFGMDSVFPFTVFADKQGRIFTVKVGELHQDEADVILDGLRDVDTGKSDISAARQKISAEIARLDEEHARQSSATTPQEPPRS
jgi:thiol-disulfide isomerase/thioredoxin